MSIIKTVAALVALTLLAGCKDIQTCNGTSAKQTALKIIGENSLKRATIDSQKELQLIGAEAALVDIKTTDSNDKLGVYECSANYTIKYNNEPISVPVTYSLSHVEDKNTTDVRVRLGKVPAIYSLISREILKVKAEEFNKLINDYVTKRGSKFTNEIAPCLANEILTYKQNHNEAALTANNLTEFEKTCATKLGESAHINAASADVQLYTNIRAFVPNNEDAMRYGYGGSDVWTKSRILINDYIVDKRGSDIPANVWACINEEEFLGPPIKGAWPLADYKTFTANDIAEWDKACTARIAAAAASVTTAK